MAGSLHGLRRCCIAAVIVMLPGLGSSANAALNTTYADESFATAAKSFDFLGATFTFSGTGDIFNPAAIQTSADGAVTAFGGFLGIPVSPSTDFPGRGSGIVEYGPEAQYASFTSPTTIPFSNGDNYLGLRASIAGVSYFGFAHTTDTTLDSYGFETAADTPVVLDTNVSAVPEPATWAMMIGGIGLTGGMMRRSRKVCASVAYA